MNKKIYISLLSAVVAGASSVMAQDLKKDVVIERDVEPAVRAANRLSYVAPSVLQPKVEKRKLTLSEYTGTGTLNCCLPRLEPAAYADTFAVSPYRGYAAIGFLPGFNLGASAGYRFVDTETTKLGAWLQYDGSSYTAKRLEEYYYDGGNDELNYDYKVKRHTFTIGAEFENEFRVGSLGIDFAYTHDYATQPCFAKDFAQNVNKIEFGTGWNAKSHSTPWNINLSLDYFGFGKALDAKNIIGFQDITPKAVNEFIFGVNGGIEKVINGHHVGLDVDARFQNLNQLSYSTPIADLLLGGGTDAYAPYASYQNYGAKTLGITSLKPHYLYSNGNLTANIGVKVDFSTGGYKKGVYFSPDVKVAYAPTAQFALYAKVDGGKELNTLAELFEDSQFMSSAYSYERSKVPYDAKFGINVGPFYGFTAELWGAYSKASDWLMPASYVSREFFAPMDVKGFRYGARLAYQYNDIFKIHAQAEGAQAGEGKGYYKWRDNARWVINAGISVSPIKPLEINLDWNLRTKRHLYAVTPALGHVGSMYYAYWTSESESLGNANSIDISASYRITDAFSVFANVENLLSKHWKLTSEIQNQGIHGLVGVTYKF